VEWFEPPLEYRLIVDGLTALRMFTEAAEGDQVTLYGLFRLQRKLKADWGEMAAAGNPVAAELIQLLDERFTTTANGALMQAAYMMTIDGHAEYHPLYVAMATSPANLAEEMVSAIQEFAEVCRTIIESFIELTILFFPDADRTRIGALVHAYLANEKYWSPGEGLVTGWGNRKWAASRRARDSPDRTADYQFAAAAEILTQVPASEAAAERLISVFEYLFGKQRMAAQLDLIQAQMLIRMLQIYHPEDIEAAIG
jgi:hypothetical protein